MSSRMEALLNDLDASLSKLAVTEGETNVSVTVSDLLKKSGARASAGHLDYTESRAALSFDRRFVVFVGTQMYLFASEQPVEKPLDVLNVSAKTFINADPMPNSPQAFEVSDGVKTWILQAPSRPAKHSWMDLVKRMISDASGYDIIGAYGEESFTSTAVVPNLHQQQFPRPPAAAPLPNGINSNRPPFASAPILQRPPPGMMQQQGYIIDPQLQQYPPPQQQQQQHAVDGYGRQIIVSQEQIYNNGNPTSPRTMYHQQQLPQQYPPIPNDLTAYQQQHQAYLQQQPILRRDQNDGHVIPRFVPMNNLRASQASRTSNGTDSASLTSASTFGGGLYNGGVGGDSLATPESEEEIRFLKLQLERAKLELIDQMQMNKILVTQQSSQDPTLPSLRLSADMTDTSSSIKKSSESVHSDKSGKSSGKSGWFGGKKKDPAEQAAKKQELKENSIKKKVKEDRTMMASLPVVILLFHLKNL
ncbi:hypothetical protein HK100_009674 [Physocladia obscura]|uniref:PH domain-containing protein n=1 Tax=Physocladia obscura TaxID=109957 RepID=A0AAD5T5R7_9FUNG|nr:hypothetical protein HK100_009674 [Physocladia obscura]